MVDGKIIKEHDLFIKSSGWNATIDYNPIPKYLSLEQETGEGLLLPAEAINEIKSSDEQLYSTFSLVDDFGNISGDNFKLETTIKNSYNDKWAVCQTTKLVILGTSGALIIPFTKLGCVSDIGLMLNDVYLDGKKNDLSVFGVDLSSFKKITVQTLEKNLEISVEEKLIYSHLLNESIGQIVGFRYRFLGAGEVGNFKLTSPSGNIESTNGKKVISTRRIIRCIKTIRMY